MDLSSINPILLLASLMVAATPLLLAAVGELVVEKAGVLNLGVEGMMITGAICGFAVAVETGSPLIGFAAAAVGGAALSLLLTDNVVIQSIQLCSIFIFCQCILAFLICNLIIVIRNRSILRTTF